MANSVAFSYLENNFIGEKLTNEELIKSLQNKEAKLKKYYTQNINIDEFWLVLMIGSLSSASFELKTIIFTIEPESTFDKVFLVEDFNMKIFLL